MMLGVNEPFNFGCRSLPKMWATLTLKSFKSVFMKYSPVIVPNHGSMKSRYSR